MNSYNKFTRIMDQQLCWQDLHDDLFCLSKGSMFIS
jgi:hypothetical protein